MEQDATQSQQLHWCLEPPCDIEAVDAYATYFHLAGHQHSYHGWDVFGLNVHVRMHIYRHLTPRSLALFSRVCRALFHDSVQFTYNFAAVSQNRRLYGMYTTELFHELRYCLWTGKWGNADGNIPI